MFYVYSNMRACLGAMAATLLAGCAYAAQPSSSSAVAIEPGMQAQKGDATPARREITAQVLSVESGEIRLASKEVSGEMVVQTPPELAAKLAQAKGRAFDTVALQHESPAGRAVALSLKDERGVFAVVESIRDRPLLTVPDRGGIQVEQLTAGERTFVFDAPCATHYNVATAFLIDGNRTVLQAGETREVRARDANYTVSLEKSRLVVPKECPATFEGARREIDYVVVRN